MTSPRHPHKAHVFGPAALGIRQPVSLLLLPPACRMYCTLRFVTDLGSKNPCHRRLDYFCLRD